MNSSMKDMSDTGINPTVLSQITQLAQKYNIGKVILFGSRARGDYKRVSDIDLAVTGGDVIGFTLAVDEETDTLLEYDVVNLDKSVQEELTVEIQKEGRLLYEKIR
ncbi:nucleotidyltransferase domain-containing protein [Diplocloster modestus]|nr:nucleotidyltransferase domain-containing protein [Diplocloster modestus]